MSKNTNQDSNHSKIDIEKGVEETSDTTVTREVLKAKIRTGPLPDPETLAKYNDIYPNLAKEIVDMARVQSEHRQSLEKIKLETEVKLRLRGQLIGGLTIAILIILGFVLILLDKNIAGVSSIVIALLGIIYSISYGKNKDN